MNKRPHKQLVKDVNELFLDGVELRLTLKYPDRYESYDISLVHKLDDNLLYKMVNYPFWRTSDYIKKPTIKKAVNWTLRNAPTNCKIASLFINGTDITYLINKGE